MNNYHQMTERNTMRPAPFSPLSRRSGYDDLDSECRGAQIDRTSSRMYPGSP